MQRALSPLIVVACNTIALGQLQVTPGRKQERLYLLFQRRYRRRVEVISG